MSCAMHVASHSLVHQNDFRSLTVSDWTCAESDHSDNQAACHLSLKSAKSICGDKDESYITFGDEAIYALIAGWEECDKIPAHAKDVSHEDMANLESVSHEIMFEPVRPVASPEPPKKLTRAASRRRFKSDQSALAVLAEK